MSQANLDDKIEILKRTLIKTNLKYKEVVFSTSLSAEDMVLTDIIARHIPEIKVITLDTGRLHEQTYALLAKVQKDYDIPIHVFYPNQERVSDYVNSYGINAFYYSINLRKSCCEIRKIEPLRAALASADAWITGLRRSQSITRDDMPESSWDELFQVQKINPLIDWSEAEIWQYIKRFQVSYNELHDQHFPSIGCSPCTRPVAIGEDIRAGRWWWEDPESKECGLHAIPVTQIEVKQA